MASNFHPYVRMLCMIYFDVHCKQQISRIFGIWSLPYNMHATMTAMPKKTHTFWKKHIKKTEPWKFTQFARIESHIQNQNKYAHILFLLFLQMYTYTHVNILDLHTKFVCKSCYSFFSAVCLQVFKLTRQVLLHIFAIFFYFG